MVTTQRLARSGLARTRKGWDAVLAAHYYYKKDESGKHLSYRTVGDLFGGMPKATVQSIIKRTPKESSEVRLAAIRFGLISPIMYKRRGGSGV